MQNIQNIRTPRWDRDIFQYVDAIPYGEVMLVIKRADRRTVSIETTGRETLRYTNNDDAQRDLQGLVARLIESGYTGEAHLKLEMKEGRIVILSVFDKKQTKY